MTTEQQCFLKSAHGVHFWYHTTSGGGHMLGSPDPTEANVTGPYECPGLLVAETSIGNPEPRSSIVGKINADLGALQNAVARVFPEAELRPKIIPRQEAMELLGECDLRTDLNLVDALATIVRLTETSGLRLSGTWLAEEVGGCTCGSPLGPYPHEPNCGLEPVVDLSTLPGWGVFVAEIRRSGMTLLTEETDPNGGDTVARTWREVVS